MKLIFLMLTVLLVSSCDENYGGEAHRSSIYFETGAPGRMFVKLDEGVQVIPNDNGLYFFENGKMYLLFASMRPGKVEYHYWSDADLAKILHEDPKTKPFLDPRLPCFGIEWLKKNPKETNRSIDADASVDNNELSYRKWMTEKEHQYCG